MPGLLSDALRNKAFIGISLLLLPALSAQAEDFDSGLREGRTHGAEILLKHEDALKPSAPEAVPGYGAAQREKLQKEGRRWTEDPEEMRTGAEEAISGEGSGTSDAAGFLRKSSAQRPVFTIDPETDPMMRTSKEAMESAAPRCDKKEACVEYADASWEKREECYEEASFEVGECEVRKNVSVTEEVRTWRYMTLEIDRNDAGAGFSAGIDTDGDGLRDATVSAPACLDRQRGEVWGDFGGVTLGGPHWKECFALDGSGSFVPAPEGTCVSVFGPTASAGRLPLGDGASQNASLQNVLASAIGAKFPPPAGSSVTAVVEARWDRARRCREGDGDGNGWRAEYTARRTVSRTDVSTENRCGSYEANPKCELAGNLCVASTVTPEGETVCTNRRMTYRCAGPPAEGPDCAALRAEGCYQTGANCVMWSREHPEEPDPPGADRGSCLVYENAYECPKNLRLCSRKSEVFECDAEIRCSSGGDCFDTSTEQSVDFPKSASRMAMLADMERCLATTADGQSSEDGYAPLEVGEAGGGTVAPIDCADTAGDEVTVFKGKRYRCDINLAGTVQNCCGKKGLFAGSCPGSTGELRARRDGAGACHYVGIHKKKALGITLKKRKVYCCFNSKMARVVHEQARGQLVEKGLWAVAENGGWGEAKNPFCGGITTEQLQEIDFDAVDFSEIYEDILDEADAPGLDGSTRSVGESVEKLCPRGSEELDCGGEGER